MRELSVQEHKEYALDILVAVHKFCAENNLKYFLTYGTLIGAIRHKGFIPWDDDIDIWMPREDYNKFLESFHTEDGRYQAVSPFEERARHSFIKVIDTKTRKIENCVDYSNGFLGIDIDIFPLDGQPDDESAYLAWYNELHSIYKKFVAWILDLGQCSIKAKAYYSIVKLFAPSKKALLKKAESIHSQYQYACANFVGSKGSLYENEKDRFPKEWLAESTDVEFEGKLFKAPKEYDKILTKLYGDYMTPPEDQTTHHNNRVFEL